MQSLHCEQAENFAQELLPESLSCSPSDTQILMILDRQERYVDLVVRLKNTASTREQNEQQ